MVRSNDGYYVFCEYQAKADAVEAKRRLHHSREPLVLRKEHADGYWAHKAATGLKIDSVSRPKALACLDELGFPDVDGGWDSILLKSKRGTRLSDMYKATTASFYEEEERANKEAVDAAKRKEEMRRRRRRQLNIPDDDSFDEDIDFLEPRECERELRRSAVRSQLGLADYDSFDED